MLTIGKLTPGRATYYSEQLPGGQDEYYTRSQDPQPGMWLGSATSRLGLSGRVDAEQFRQVLDAVNPTSGQPLDISRTTTARLAGFDLCFSAPKSVSVAWALATPEVSEMIAAAHDRAVTKAVEALEVEVIRARRGAAGRHSVETEGVAAAAFAHRSSRAGDPQIHTHLVVANLTPDRQGHWRAIDGARVYRWAKTLGYLYQAQLRAELTDTLGLRWGPVKNGAADLAGIDPELLEVFSKRAAQIAQVTGNAHLPLAAAKTVTLATRASKASLPDLDILRDRWRHEADQLTINTTRIENLIDAADHPVAVRPQEVIEQLLSGSGLTAHASTFDRRDVLQALAGSYQHGESIDALRDLAQRVIDHDRVVALIVDRRTGTRYSTSELMNIEAQVLHSATSGADAALAVADREHLSRALAARPSLSEEQQQMVTSLTTSGAAVEVVVGRAGAGKTFALDAARHAWQTSGHHVIGAALAARAAAELQAGTGIASTTLDRLLGDLDQAGPLSPLPPRGVVIVDEAAMVGTRKLARLLDHTRRAHAKVVLLGDHRQVPEIDAGGAFAALTALLPTTELVDNRRQTNRWEQAALAEIRARVGTRRH